MTRHYASLYARLEGTSGGMGHLYSEQLGEHIYRRRARGQPYEVISHELEMPRRLVGAFAERYAAEHGRPLPGMAGRSRYTDAIGRLIHEYHKKGEAYSRIATRLGLSTRTIARYDSLYARAREVADRPHAGDLRPLDASVRAASSASSLRSPSSAITATTSGSSWPVETFAAHPVSFRASGSAPATAGGSSRPSGTGAAPPASWGQAELRQYVGPRGGQMNPATRDLITDWLEGRTAPPPALQDAVRGATQGAWTLEHLRAYLTEPDPRLSLQVMTSISRWLGI